ncbi:hypothetical protein GQ53DRAFT_730900 [Thozetella sp. PMI_491]|nr:hypothetical protein GQ53DRAFT_730900 [Thozetella sp. PMI_491]
MLAVVQDSTPSAGSDAKLFFGLGSDSAVWYRKWDGSTWTNSWTSLGGQFLSQPSAVTFRDNQTNVWVIDQNFVMSSIAYKSGVWDKSWLSLGGVITAAPTSCSHQSGVLDIFVRGTDGALFQNNWNESSAVGYTGWLRLDGWLSSAPVVTCAAPDRMDVVLLGDTQSPYPFFVKRWTGSAWQDYVKLGGDFRGEPTAVSFSSERSDYFGIGADGAMYHATWTSSSGYGSWTNLGGSFESSPHAFVTGSSRIDVLGVGTDDHLKHKAMINEVWSSDWDDLGGSFNSAPVAVTGSSGNVTVFGLSKTGALFHKTWAAGNDRVWSKGSDWVEDGGSLGTKWFRPGPVS